MQITFEQLANEVSQMHNNSLCEINWHNGIAMKMVCNKAEVIEDHDKQPVLTLFSADYDGLTLWEQAIASIEKTATEEMDIYDIELANNDCHIRINNKKS